MYNKTNHDTTDMPLLSGNQHEPTFFLRALKNQETYSPKVDRAQTWIQNTDISTENVSVKEMFEETKMKTKNQKTEK